MKKIIKLSREEKKRLGDDFNMKDFEKRFLLALKAELKKGKKPNE